MRLVFLGSGAFGLPTLAALRAEHEVALVVSQPDRPAGRNRVPTPTPVAELAASAGMPTIKPDRVNERAVIERIAEVAPDALVVIAYGHKLGPDLLEGRFAVNLHASLLPKYRGAAPINWAIINGERETGVSVIGLSQRMDAGEVYAARRVAIDPRETAGELHDRLAALGPEAILETLARRRDGALAPTAQDESLATAAPKLAKADGTVWFDQPADAVRCRVHGLTPWPGCTVLCGEHPLKLLRVDVIERGRPVSAGGAPPGTVREDLSVACAPGSVRLLEVQPPGGVPMSMEAYCRGRDVHPGVRMSRR
jgi:methionyl-tRNA formyltransferase